MKTFYCTLVSAFALACTAASPIAVAQVSMPSDWKGPEIKGPPQGPGACGPGPDIANIRNKHLDVPYASVSPAQKMDIYLPHDGRTKHPVIIAIHGGAFFGCDKYDGQLAPMLKGLARGYAVVSINYRLSHQAPWPAQINDVKAAIKYVRANAGKYGFDPARLVLWGGSAGGHLSALAGTSADVKSLEDPKLGNADVSTKVRAVVDWFGPINFLTMDEQWKTLGINGEKHSTPDSFESFLMRRQITEVPEKVATANAETYLTLNAPPYFIQHGDADSTIPCLQSKEFAEKLVATIGSKNVHFEYLHGAKHADPSFGNAENVEKVFAFLQEHLK